jgi:hypothetical protein
LRVCGARASPIRKRFKPEEIVAKLRQVEVLQSQGMVIGDSVGQIGVTEVTYYRWRREYGGMRTDQLKRLKVLEKENATPPIETLPLHRCFSRPSRPALGVSRISVSSPLLGGYDEPEILPCSIGPICLKGANIG